MSLVQGLLATGQGLLRSVRYYIGATATTLVLLLLHVVAAELLNGRWRRENDEQHSLLLMNGGYFLATKQINWNSHVSTKHWLQSTHLALSMYAQTCILRPYASASVQTVYTSIYSQTVCIYLFSTYVLNLYTQTICTHVYSDYMDPCMLRLYASLSTGAIHSRLANS